MATFGKVRQAIAAIIIAVGVLTFFLPSISITVPILGKMQRSPLNVVSHLSGDHESNIPSYSDFTEESGKTDQAPPNVPSKATNMPLGITFAPLIPIGIALAYLLLLCAAAAIFVKPIQRFVGSIAVLGITSSGAALVSVFLFSNAVQQSLAPQMNSPGMHDNPFARLGEALTASVNIEPGVGLYLLVVTMIGLIVIHRFPVLDRVTVSQADPQLQAQPPLPAAPKAYGIVARGWSKRLIWLAPLAIIVIVGSVAARSFLVSHRQRSEAPLSTHTAAFPSLRAQPLPQGSNPSSQETPPDAEAGNVSIPAVTVSKPNRVLEVSANHDVCGVDYFNTPFSDGETTVPLRGGQYEPHEDFGNELLAVKHVFCLEPGVGKHALLVADWQACGASCTKTGIVQVIGLRGDNPMLVQQIHFDSYAPGTGATFDNAQLTLTIVGRSDDNSPRCCPANLDVVTYRWDGQEFVQTSFKRVPVPTS